MHDLRLALRNLIRRPAFSIIAVLTLALGIGANTAVFTVSHGVLLAPLPYERPADVVVLYEQTPEFPTASVTRFNYEDWRARATSFVEMAAFRPTGVTVVAGGEAERLPVKMITASLLPLLGVRVEHGRGFVAADDRAGAEAVALLSAGFARRTFGEAEAPGRVVHLDGRPVTVVGVLPPEFELFQPADVYVPFWPWASTLPDDRGWHPGIIPVARLKPGVTLEDARREMTAIAQQLEAEFPESNRNVRVVVARVQDQLVDQVRPALAMLTAAVALVLLIACANVANLLLARAVDRRKEIALRFALGASRTRIGRQLLVESLVLALVGGAAGLLVASWAVSLITGTAVPALPRAGNIAVEWPVVFFALALSVLTGILFGFVPAVQAAQLPIRESLNEEGRGGTASVRHRKTRSALVITEIALALVLLVGAGLLFRSFTRLTSVPPGFRTENLLLVNVPLSAQKYDNDAVRVATVDRILSRVQALPGVQDAAVTTTVPMSGPGTTIHFNRASDPPEGPDDYVLAGLRAVTPNYFQVLGVPVLRGRTLTAWDRDGSPPVVVINESMAVRYFPGRDPIGERIQLGTEPSPDLPVMEVVGVVGDVRQSFATPPEAEMFVPYAQRPTDLLTGMYLNVALVLRTTADAGSVAGLLRSAIREVDPWQPLVNVRTMKAAMAGTVAQPRLQMTLLMVFASVAVALAAVGVYGVMAYTVSQRVPEIGVRIALGASPRHVVRMVVWQGARLALAGLVLGVIAAALAAGAIQGLLFRVRGLDPLTFAIAPIVLCAAAVLASYIPARRAARISPVEAIVRS